MAEFPFKKSYNFFMLNNCLDLVFLLSLDYRTTVSESYHARNNAPLYKIASDTSSDMLNAT